MNKTVFYFLNWDFLLNVLHIYKNMNKIPFFQLLFFELEFLTVNTLKLYRCFQNILMKGTFIQVLSVTL